MRVISGTRRGTNLFSPTTEDTRPTTDRVRENIFNLIRFDLPDAKVLDLFAGSGAMGIEALSQGAKSCVFVDSLKSACEIVKKNLEKTRLEGSSFVINKSFENYLSTANEVFDIIFLDPPYHNKYIDRSLDIIVSRGLASRNALFVLETDKEESVNIPSEYEVIKEKIYGRVKVTLVKRGG